jgi:medium-chain acyl-[acyl-carrier-protein] hydrolase
MGGPGTRTARLSKRFRVRSFEADPLGRLQVPILCRLLQEAATAHAAELGVAVDALVDSGVAWVLNRLDLHVQRWPRSDDEIVIETWPSAMNRLLTERRFRIVDSSGQESGRASTLWLVLDLERRRPVRLPAHVVENLQKLGLAPDPNRPDELAPPDTITSELGFSVRRSDVDLAGHANNTSFVEWVVEAVPDQVWSACNLSDLSIQFLAECRRGQTVLSRSQLLGDDETPEVRHQLIREEDGVEVARALTTWCPHKPSERQRSNVSTF